MREKSKWTKAKAGLHLTLAELQHKLKYGNKRKKDLNDSSEGKQKKSDEGSST